MVLKDVDLTERKKLTSHYPVLMVGETSSGKSTAIANLSDEEKARTVIFNFDNKAISEDDSKFLKVYQAFKVSDIDMIDKIESNLLKAAASDKVDRVIVDTFTLMTKLINRWAMEHYSGFDVWSSYNNAITRILESTKVATITYGKFIYVMAHYPPRIGVNGTKRYVTTKGKEHTNIIEESFSTVVEAYMADRAFWFEADVFNEMNTTKTKLKEGCFKFKRTSLDDLELVLAGKKEVPVIED